MTTGLIIYLLFAHFFADFSCQGTYLGTNKSNSNWILTTHILIYATIMYLLLLPTELGIAFVAANASLHWIVDWCSSRIGKKFYNDGKIYAFWNTIAADQFVHLALLVYIGSLV